MLDKSHRHAPRSTSKRIVIATLGTLGDVHPYLALGQGLRSRGHDVSVATNVAHARRVEGAGLQFHVLPSRFTFDEKIATEMLSRFERFPEEAWNHVTTLLTSSLREQYDALETVIEGAHLLVVSNSLPVFAAPILAEKKGIPWISGALQPSRFFSRFDPPRRWGAPLEPPEVVQQLKEAIKQQERTLMQPIDDLRLDLGLPQDPHPMFEGLFSPILNLALFPDLLAAPQSDWPSNTVATGYCIYDGGAETDPFSPALHEFLDAGSPPIVFTLGSADVFAPREFYSVSARIAQKVGVRAVLVGADPTREDLRSLPEEITTTPYASYSSVFPRAAITVHQGGAGTLAQAMRAGRPMLIVPQRNDQWDNARRAVELGLGRTLARVDYTVDRGVQELKALLDGRYVSRCSEISAAITAHDGVATACDAIEGVLSRG